MSLRQRAAREIVADPNFERLLITLEAATTPVIPRRALRVFFETSHGSVGEVLDELLDAYPQTVSVEVLLEDARWVGALAQERQAEELETQLVLVKAELEAVRADMTRWDTFMLGRPWRLGRRDGSHEPRRVDFNRPVAPDPAPATSGAPDRAPLTPPTAWVEAVRGG